MEIKLDWAAGFRFPKENVTDLDYQFASEIKNNHTAVVQRNVSFVFFT